MRADIAVRLGGLPSDDGQDVTRSLVDEASDVTDVNAGEPGFDLCRTIDALGLERSEEVLLNWRHFDNVDRIRLVDLCNYFSDIWYPSSDDIEIIHPERQWIVSVSHDGDVRSICFT